MILGIDPLYMYIMAVFGYIHVNILILAKLVQCSLSRVSVWLTYVTHVTSRYWRHTCSAALAPPLRPGPVVLNVGAATLRAARSDHYSHCSAKKSFPFRSFWKMNGFWAIVLFIGYTAASRTPSKLYINVLNVLLSRGPPYLQCKCV